MRLSINLASRPFVELRPVLLRLRIAMVALVLLAIGLGVGDHVLNARAKDAQARMDAVRAQTTAFQTERQTNERRMQQPANRAVLERSQFLNDVFARKSFSWTSVMMDLERVLPPGVQVTSIEPTVTPEGGVNIRLRVSGDRDRAVELVRNLERSQRFLNPRLADEAAQTQESGRPVAVAQVSAPGAVEFDILSSYNPLPATGAAVRPRTAGPTPNAPGSASAPHRRARQGAGLAPRQPVPARPVPARPVPGRPGQRGGGR